MIEIRRYTKDDRRAWDDFVESSRNATFLHKRDYMEYHADRFTDFSLIFTNDKGKIVALLPASISGDTVSSHAGLTYGGFLVNAKATAIDLLQLMDATADYLCQNGVRRLIYKPVPYIYAELPSQEDIYALFRVGAKIEAVNCSSVIDLRSPLGFDENNRRNVKAAIKNGVEISESQDFEGFWEMLTCRLDEKYGATPVHTVGEIESLAAKFPDNIRLFVAHKDGDMLAGILLYVTKTCAHCQYIASTVKGRELRAMSLLVNRLIEEVGSEVRYFDFGTSNEQGGRYLNEGLIGQKNRMGGRGVAYPIYSLDI